MEENEHEKDEESTNDDVQQPENHSKRAVDYVKGTFVYVDTAAFEYLHCVIRNVFGRTYVTQ